MDKDTLELIKIGEGHNLEFKQGLNSSIGRDICAFANSFGGKILLGIKDDGDIQGIELSNSEKARIQDIARNMNPSPELNIKISGEIVVIDVPEGNKKPYSVNGHFFIRTGAVSQQLKRDEIRCRVA